MSNKTIQTMRLVGGHPALDLVNTVDARRGSWGPDLLVSYADAVSWASRTGVIDAEEATALIAKANDKRAAESALRRLAGMRETLYAVLRATAESRLPAGDDSATLADVVQEAWAHRRLSLADDGRFGWTWCDDTLDTILHRVVFAAAELLTDPARRPVTVCDGPNCGWLFLDRSRAGRRRWCSDESCGSHDRVRRHRAKPSTSAE